MGMRIALSFCKARFTPFLLPVSEEPRCAVPDRARCTPRVDHTASLSALDAPGSISLPHTCHPGVSWRANSSIRGTSPLSRSNL